MIFRKKNLNILLHSYVVYSVYGQLYEIHQTKLCGSQGNVSFFVMQSTKQAIVWRSKVLFTIL